MPLEPTTAEITGRLPQGKSAVRHVKGLSIARLAP
jgi:hypothetical protein